MGLTGKYDFQGLKRVNAAGIKAIISSVPLLAWLARFDALMNMLGNWAANSGLMLLNLGAIYVEGEIDQKLLDRALESGWDQIETQGRDKISPEQGKAIDDAVRKAMDKAIPLSPGKPKRP